MKYFWIDSSRKTEVTYEDFFQQLVDEGTNSIFVKAENPYYLFLNLLRNCINGRESIILDADFSLEELDSLGVTIDEINKSQYRQSSLKGKFTDFDDVLFFLETNKHKLSVQIFTSGTTGQPKIVSQSLLNLARAVKKDSKFEDNIWAFAYNASHFAGLQVFFQALFNKNKIVYIFNSDYKLIYADLVNHDITHLSCTPTFLKMLLPNIVQPIRTLASITSGGEKFDTRINDNLNYLFPKAVVKNVYASTEAGSLLRANGEFFVIPERYKALLKIVDDQLLINKELLGNSGNFELIEDWYNSGDIVEFKDDLKIEFKFKSRKTEMINIGGYKVNPEEIENLIRGVQGVKDVIVFGRKNSIMGNIIETNIIKEDSFSDIEIKKEIKLSVKKLQEFKHPRIIKIVENFELTRTGKVKKN